MKLISNPWRKAFLSLVKDSKESIRISSPFVKQDVFQELMVAKQASARLELVTAFKIGNVRSGSLDLSALEAVLDSHGKVRNHNKLHAKIYLFDSRKAVVTSGNLTTGGLVRNFEYGVFIDEPDLIQKVKSDFDTLVNDENTLTVTKKEIDVVRKIISKLEPLPKIDYEQYKYTPSEEANDVVTGAAGAVVETLTGWKRDVFNILDSIDHPLFSLEQVYKYERQLKLLHPQNNNVRDKIRQQLQYLRNLGLLEFYAPGKYRKLWT
jgi:hypothetical protein